MRYAKRLSLILLLLLLVLGLTLTGLWQSFKARQQITTLNMSGWSLSAQGLVLDSLELKRGPAQAKQYLRADQLVVSLQALRMQRLEVSVPQSGTPQAGTPLVEDLSQLVPSWMPKELHIHALELELPCQAQRCRLTGALQASLDASHQLQGHLRLSHLKHTLDLTLTADLKRISVLNARLSVNGEAKATLRNALVNNLWQGALNLAPMPEFAWLLPWLNQWVTGLEALPALPVADASLHWQISPPLELNWPALKQSTGHVSLTADIIEDWPLAEVGLVKGHVQAALSQTSSGITLNTLRTDLRLTPKDAPWLNTLPADVRPSALNLVLTESANPIADALTLDALLTLEGPLTGTVKGPLALYMNAPTPVAILTGAALSLSAKSLNSGVFKTRDAALNASLDAELSLATVALSTRTPVTLSAKTLVWDELSAQALSLNFKPHKAQLTWTPQTLDYQIDGPLTAKAVLTQTHLNKATWQWPAQLHLTPAALSLKGPLSNSYQLQADTELSHTFNGATQLSARLNPIDLSHANPLQKSLSAWPATLELASGVASLNAKVQLPSQQTPNVRLTGQLKKLSGLYETVEFSELSGPIELGFKASMLNLSSANLTLGGLNSGIAMGPARADVSYQAKSAQLTKGVLTVNSFDSSLFGGRIWLKPQRIDLAQANPSSTLYIQGVQIQTLLAAYPAEGLAGMGTLDGQLPVTLTHSGLQIAEGQLKAREPGGRLQFKSDKLTALGKSNPAMQLAADALSDFRFHTLTSGVSLNPQGTLKLAFNLAGYNPDLQKGRPINFTINLEEDLPALLKSLQLSGKVSERIEQRVRQQLNAPN